MPGLLIHEWLAPAGGSENVAEEFVRTFPDADLFVLWNDRASDVAKQVYESWLAATPLRRHKAAALPFMPATWRTLRARTDYEWMLVSSHLFAHHVRLRGPDVQPPKLVYVHTPARYVWAPEHDARGAGLIARAASTAIKPLDRSRSHEARAVAANSRFTQQRIRDCWGLDATVIYPPVDTETIQSVPDWRTELSEAERELLDGLPQGYLLGASRFVPYKRLDLVIAAGDAAGRPVVLAGGGPAQAELRARADAASVPVSFVDRPSSALLYALYQYAHAYVFPAVEDFGIMPVEAMAVGTPVIVPVQGGASESVGSLAGGVSIDDFSAGAIRAGLADIERIDRAALTERAGAFSRARFREQISWWVRKSVLQ